jgi:hypothetical protein
MSNLTIGKIVNNSVTLVLHTSDLTPGTRGQADRAIVPAIGLLPATESHADFFVNIPNSMGFTHKTRCLCRVESVNGKVSTANEPTRQIGSLGVRIAGMYPRNVFKNGHDDLCLGVVHFHSSDDGGLRDFDPVTPLATEGQDTANGVYLGVGDIINDGVLCHSPFGKRLRVEVYELSTGTRLSPIGYAAYGKQSHLADNDLTVKLRILFLDENDLKDY